MLLNVQAVAACGKHWREVAKHVTRRSDKQCRERYANALSPDLRLYAEWTPEEDALLLRAVREQTQPNGRVRSALLPLSVMLQSCSGPHISPFMWVPYSER